MHFFGFICLFVSGVLGILGWQICNIIESAEYKMGDFWRSSDLFSSLIFFLIICKSFIFLFLGLSVGLTHVSAIPQEDMEGNFFKSGTKG